MKDLRYWKYQCVILEEKLSAYQGWCNDDTTFLGQGLCASPASTVFSDELPWELVGAGVVMGKGKKEKIGAKDGVKKRDVRGRFCRVEKGYKA